MVLGTKLALQALIVALKRLYSVDLEFRTDREERRAAFYEASKHALEAERAWRDGVEPKGGHRSC